MTVMFEPLYQLASTLFRCIDASPAFALSFFVIACRVMVARIDRFSFVLPNVAGGIFLFSYFVRCLDQYQDDFGALANGFFRSIVGYEAVRSIAIVFLTAVTPVVRWLRSTFFDIHRRIQAIRKELRERREEQEQLAAAARVKPPAPRPEPPPPTPRAERLRMAAQDAQKDYQAEIAAMADLTLTARERQVLQDKAKQRLIKKLSTLQDA